MADYILKKKKCSHWSHGEMRYCGNGNYECDVCGETYHDDDFGIIDDGGLNAWDAAEIWLSNGKDEDYMFGYSEEELLNALK